MESIEAWCMKCGCMRMIKSPVVRKMTSGRLYAQGLCPVCGKKVNKMVPLALLKPEQIEQAVPVAETMPRHIDVVQEPEPDWMAFCRYCGKEQPVVGFQAATLWDGRKVVHGRCTGCNNEGNFQNARSLGES